MGVLSATKTTVGRWYISAVLITALGIAVGYLLFFGVFPRKPQIGIIDIPFTAIFEDEAFVIGEMLDYAERTDSIKAVVVKLVTPGGGVAESEALYRKLARLRQEKPVVISSGWINAGGGMLMSLGANYVYAEASSLVGSIGVIGGLPRPQPPLEFVVTSGPAKLTGGSQRTFTGIVEIMKDSFIRTVRAERGDRLRMTDAELAEARIYTGIEAVRLGLVDALGSDRDAVNKAASLAGISNYERVDVNEKVFRELVLRLRRIFASPDLEEPQLQMSDVGRLRRIASDSQEQEGRAGVPSDVPIAANLPRMFYLYVTPTE